jgi:hypothetical protein
MTDTLFLLTPGFLDGDTRYFCPFCAQVTGYLSYYPEVRSTVWIVEVDFARPREKLVAFLGEANQSCPVLILGDDARSDVPGVDIGEANGYRFVSKTIQILKYLAATRGTPGPH